MKLGEFYSIDNEEGADFCVQMTTPIVTEGKRSYVGYSRISFVISNIEPENDLIYEDTLVVTISKHEAKKLIDVLTEIINSEEPEEKEVLKHFNKASLNEDINLQTIKN